MKSWLLTAAVVLLALTQVGLTPIEPQPRDGIYRFTHAAVVAAQLIVVDGNLQVKSRPIDWKFSRGENVAVEFDVDGSALLSLKSPSKGQPEKIVLSAKAFAAADLHFLRPGSLRNLASAF